MYTALLLKKTRTQGLQMLWSLGADNFASRRVGWPPLQEVRSRRQKSGLACRGMQHPLGNTPSCSLMSTDESLVPKRTWVKAAAGMHRVTLTLLIQVSPGIWLELICISNQGLILIRVIGMVAGGRRQKAWVWSLLHSPGPCPAPPKATQLLSPTLTPRSFSSPTPCHQPGTKSYSHGEGTLQKNKTALQISPAPRAKPPAHSLTLSQPLSGDKEESLQGFRMCAQRAQTHRHLNAGTFACYHHQLCAFQARQASHPPSLALPHHLHHQSSLSPLLQPVPTTL